MVIVIMIRAGVRKNASLQVESIVRCGHVFIPWLEWYQVSSHVRSSHRNRTLIRRRVSYTYKRNRGLSIGSWNISDHVHGEE